MFFKRFFNKRIADSHAIYNGAFAFDLKLPSAKRVLALAAHPDDETLGCGGILSLHKQAGAEVRALVFTDGGGVHYEGGEDVSEVRKREAIEAGKILGVNKFYFNNIPDGKLQQNREQAETILYDVLSEYNPDLVYAPSPVDFHPDHRLVYLLALEAAGRGIKTAFYEIYAPLRFNLLIDITEVMHLKERAFLEYKTSLVGNPQHFWMAFKGLNAYRRFMMPISNEERYYEAFWVIDGHMKERDVISWLLYDR